MEYARDRLSAERRKNILNHAAADELEETLDLEKQAPPLRRGDVVDVAWQALFSDVGTALDEYREQAGEVADNALAVEQSIETPQTADIAVTIAQSEQTEVALQKGQADALQLLGKDNVEAQIFLRTMRDAEIANRLTRAELQFRSVVRRWYKKLSTNLKKYPQALRTTAKAVKSGSGVSRLAYNRFSEFLTDVGNFGFDQLDKTADMFDNMGKVLEQRQQKIKIPPVDPEVQEAAEKATTRLLKENKPVPDDIALNVRNINLSFSDFENPDLLVNFKWLLSLNVWDTKVSDIGVLANLPNLQQLNLNSTQVSDIGVLTNLPNLQQLYLSDTQVSDIGVLANLPNLQHLHLSNTQVSDIGVLANLSNLHQLYFGGTQVSDIGVLANLPNLQHLYLNNTQVGDIGVLDNLSNLQHLYLGGTQVSDIGVLANLPNLSIVYAKDTKITDWSPLRHVEDVRGRPDDWDA